MTRLLLCRITFFFSSKGKELGPRGSLNSELCHLKPDRALQNPESPFMDLTAQPLPLTSGPCNCDSSTWAKLAGETCLFPQEPTCPVREERSTRATVKAAGSPHLIQNGWQSQGGHLCASRAEARLRGTMEAHHEQHSGPTRGLPGRSSVSGAR